MKISTYIIPILLIVLFTYLVIKRKNSYDFFIKGVNETIPLVISLFPYLLAILLLSELFEVSGLSNIFIKLTSPIFTFFGIPKEVIKLIIIKPFSGSGSLALLNEIIISYGADSYITKVACTLFGSSETVFYISAVYYVKCKNKNATKGILLSLIACFISNIFTCFIARFLF